MLEDGWIGILVFGEQYQHIVAELLIAEEWGGKIERNEIASFDRYLVVKLTNKIHSNCDIQHTHDNLSSISFLSYSPPR